MYDVLVEIKTSKGPLWKDPMHAFNLGSAQIPLRLIREVGFPPNSKMRIILHNTLSQGRKWNYVGINLIGEKEFMG
jgi:hypothetical protein